MESLLSAYASHSDEDDEEPKKEEEEEEGNWCLPKNREGRLESAAKRLRVVEFSFFPLPATASQSLPKPKDFGWHSQELQIPHQQYPDPASAAAAGIAPGSRYVSKRERAAAIAQQQLGSAPTHTTAILPESSASHEPPGFQGILDMNLPIHIQKRLDKARDGVSSRNHLPKEVIVRLRGHDKGVNCVRWSPTHGSLLASAGMDHVACIWKLWTEGMEQPACKVSCHTAAVKDVQWSSQGTCLLTCGFDKTSRLTDVETNCEKQIFEENQVVNTIQFHPFETDLFLSGGSKGALRLWDIRSGKVVREYFKSLGQIMDVDFSKDGKRFASTSDIAKRNASDKTIVIWDYYNQMLLCSIVKCHDTFQQSYIVNRLVVLTTEEVYMEPYTCPSVRFHPYEDCFIAQSNAGYIAAFSARPPFKLNKHKRFEGHQVSGFRVQCSFSPDGEYVVTGSADGCLFFYSYRSSKCLKTMKMHENVCTDVAYHPVLSSVVASCSWDGSVCVYD
ncbi:hypothetical protein O6H91_18G061000 [Diphasiastrum complanatum]|uniref:Uncharacterized protein n=1 Tax=Diphasiastrum complanatum TaxID=34168 RepID=A0ACC2B2W0_DIPCM|nr:hypothetical protein O6H91_18G061000 [Diphasiastrum complanatum]